LASLRDAAALVLCTLPLGNGVHTHQGRTYSKGYRQRTAEVQMHDQFPCGIESVRCFCQPFHRHGQARKVAAHAKKRILRATNPTILASDRMIRNKDSR
jgi:hypothetical protein